MPARCWDSLVQIYKVDLGRNHDERCSNGLAPRLMAGPNGTTGTAFTNVLECERLNGRTVFHRALIGKISLRIVAPLIAPRLDAPVGIGNGLFLGLRS